VDILFILLLLMHEKDRLVEASGVEPESKNS